MAAVTIYDVARKAGVSPATVSRVFNDSTLVSKTTRQRVLMIARELGYTPLKERADNGRKAVAVFVSSVLNPTLAQMIKGVQSVLRVHDLPMIVFDSDGGVSDEIKFLGQLSSYPVAGLVLSSPHISSEYLMAVRELGIPYVLAYGYSTEPDVPCVYINNLEASFQVMQELFALGHEDIAVITGPEGDSTISRQRLQGVRLAYLAAQRQLDEARIIEGDYSVESGYQAAASLVASGRPLPTAIYAFSDLMAIGALQALQEAGLRVPEDISVCGFDDIELASLVSPRLATLAQPSFQVGQESAQILLEQMERGEVRQPKRELPYQFVRGQSVQDLGKRPRAAEGGMNRG